MGIKAKGMLRFARVNKVTSASLGYPLSVCNKNSTLKWYKLETLIFNPYSYYSSMAYGNPTCNLSIGNSPSCNPSVKAMTKTKLTLPPAGAHIAMTNFLRVSS